MGIFDKLFGKKESIREEWASDKNLTCAQCGKKPLLKKNDVIPGPGVMILSGGLTPDFTNMYTKWKGKAYTIKELQKIANETVYDRAAKCTKCGKIFCVGCVNDFGNTFSTGHKGCPYCGSKMEILNGDSYTQKESDVYQNPQEFPHYDDKKLEEIKRINRENWERAQRIKDQRKGRERLELDKKQEDPVQMCWKFLDEYSEKMRAIYYGGGSWTSLEKLEQDFIRCIEELNFSGRSIAVLEEILEFQNSLVVSGVHIAAQRKLNKILSSEERAKIEEREETKTTKDVEGFINALKDGDVGVRWEAACALGEIGWTPRNRTERGYYSIAKRKLHIPVLISNLRDVGWETCNGAASALGEIAELAPDVIKPVIPELISNLSDDDKLVCGGAALAIGKISERSPEVLKSAVPSLIGFLDTKDEKVRRAAVFAIGMVGGKDPEVVRPVIQKLINFLGDEDEYVRKNAAEGIKKIAEKDPEIVKDAESEFKSKKVKRSS